MTHQHRLLDRLDAIGRSLAATGRARALLGLGSVGQERDRLDEYSDLDFFVIAADGAKQAFLDDLGWLSAVAPIAFQVRNTVDGYKALYDDGIFCEFAVFEAAELAAIPFAAGRIVWQDGGFSEALAIPADAAPEEPRSLEWLLGEALTNLYVGLGRFRRGERLSAARFIQQYAVDHALRLAAWVEPAAAETAAQPAAARQDRFAIERRFERRFPAVAAELPGFVQGYERSPASALAILAFLERNFAVNPALARAIRALAEPAGGAIAG